MHLAIAYLLRMRSNLAGQLKRPSQPVPSRAGAAAVLFFQFAAVKQTGHFPTISAIARISSFDKKPTFA